MSLLPGSRVLLPGIFGGGYAGCADCVYSVCAAVLPADSGFERQVQHPAGGDGGEREDLQAAGSQAEIVSPATAGGGRSVRDGWSFAMSGLRISGWMRRRRRGSRRRARTSWRSFADIEWILCGVSFVVEPDETAAIVGHTGAGKTTITGLMMRFYDVQRGSILVDGVDVREQDLQRAATAVRRGAAGSVSVYGDDRGQHTAGVEVDYGPAAQQAADEVNVGEFIRSLPQQFAEPVQRARSDAVDGSETADQLCAGAGA